MPDAVVGHSSGQYVAAVLAGVMSLEVGAALMVRRGRLMSQLPRDGRMIAALTTEDRVRAAMAGHDRVDIAGLNGPEEIVVAGLTDEIDAIEAALAADGVEVRALRTSHAFHSPLMDPILDEFAAFVAEHPLSAPTGVLVENVHGRVAGDDITDPAYWAQHIRRAVRFSDSVQTLWGLGHRHFVEIGNHPVLAGMAAKATAEGGGAFHPSARRNADDWATLLATAGQLHCDGVPLDWARFHAQQPGHRIALPTTAFQRERYWVDRPGRAGSTATVGADWIHRVVWQPAPTPEGATAGRTLIFAEDGPVGSDLAEAIGDAVVVRPGSKWSLGAGAATIDPDDPDHYDRLLDAVDPDRIAYLWSLDTPATGAAMATDGAKAAVRGAVLLMQAMIRGDRSKIALITRGAQAIEGSPADVDPAQRPLWGLGAAVAIEAADLEAVRIDLDPEGTDPGGSDRRDVRRRRRGSRGPAGLGAVRGPPAALRGGPRRAHRGARHHPVDHRGPGGHRRPPGPLAGGPGGDAPGPVGAQRALDPGQGDPRRAQPTRAAPSRWCWATCPTPTRWIGWWPRSLRAGCRRSRGCSTPRGSSTTARCPT